jgi:hypothetical protein
MMAILATAAEAPAGLNQAQVSQALNNHDCVKRSTDIP